MWAPLGKSECPSHLPIPAFFLPSTAVHTINNGTNLNSKHRSLTFAILKAMHWFVMRPLVVTSQDAIVYTPSCDQMVAFTTSAGVWASLMNTKHLSAPGVKTNIGWSRMAVLVGSHHTQLMQKDVGVPSDRLLLSLKKRTYAPRTHRSPHSWYIIPTSLPSPQTQKDPNPGLVERTPPWSILMHTYINYVCNQYSIKLPQVG